MIPSRFVQNNASLVVCLLVCLCLAWNFVDLLLLLFMFMFVHRQLLTATSSGRYLLTEFRFPAKKQIIIKCHVGKRYHIHAHSRF